MGIIITGASGFVGRNIVPVLAKSGKKLLLAGRDVEYLKSLYPNVEVTSYDSLADAAKGYKTLIHLSVCNNNTPGDLARFREVNVEFLEFVINEVRSAGIKKIVYISTLHTDMATNKSPYADSKKEAEELLSKVDDMIVVILKTAAIYGSTFSGKMELLNRFPKFLKKPVFDILASMRPTVHINHISESVLRAVESPRSNEILLTDRQFGNWFYAFVKRAIDISFAITVLALFWWVLIAVWLIVKFTSDGPGFFSQVRIGKDGKIFTFYKFRTMSTDTMQVATHDVNSDNITAIGRFLRKSKIDELPQIWNILRNEMSLVGPRPCLPIQKELVAARMNSGVFRVKCGITGWAQINNIDMSDVDRLVKYEVNYIALRTLLLDFSIIFATAFGRGQGDKSVMK